MPKPILLLAGAGAVVVIGGAILVTTQKKSPEPTRNSGTTSKTQQTASKTAVVDPTGDYKVFSDPSVTKYPEKDVKFGNGQTLAFEYDGTKTNNDEYATLSYQLYYIQENGKVQPMGGGNMEGKGKGTFTVSNKVFNSSAKGKSGFLELQGTYTTGTTGTNMKLGMYPIQFDIAE